MHSVKCPVCGFVAWAGADACKKCGGSLTQDAGASSYQPQQGFSYSEDRPQSQAQRKMAWRFFRLCWEYLICLRSVFSVSARLSG